MEITSEGFVRFCDKFYQNHGVILKKPITNVQDLVTKALKELGDYHQSRDFIDRLTAKLVGQKLPTNLDQLTFLFDKLIKEVKAEMIVETNLHETLEPVGLFQQAIQITVEFAKDHPYIVGAACIATAAALGYLLYPYVKTLLGVGGSAIAGGGAGNISGNNSLSTNDFNVSPSDVVVNEENACIEDIKDILDEARLYVDQAKRLANTIADEPQISSMGDADSLSTQLREVFEYAYEDHKLINNTIGAEVNAVSQNPEVNRILMETKLTSLDADCLRQKVELVNAHIKKYDAQVNRLPLDSPDNEIQLVRKSYEQSKVDVANLLDYLYHAELETIDTPVSLNSEITEHKIDILDSFS